VIETVRKGTFQFMRHLAVSAINQYGIPKNSRAHIPFLEIYAIKVGLVSYSDLIS